MCTKLVFLIVAINFKICTSIPWNRQTTVKKSPIENTKITLCTRNDKNTPPFLTKNQTQMR